MPSVKRIAESRYGLKTWLTIFAVSTGLALWLNARRQQPDKLILPPSGGGRPAVYEESSAVQDQRETDERLRRLLVRDAAGRPVPGAVVWYRSSLFLTDGRGEWTNHPDALTRTAGKAGPVGSESFSYSAAPVVVDVLAADGQRSVELTARETTVEIGTLPLLDVRVVCAATGAVTSPESADVRYFGEGDSLQEDAFRWTPAAAMPIAPRALPARVRVAPRFATGKSGAAVDALLALAPGVRTATVTATSSDTLDVVLRCSDARSRPADGALPLSVQLTGIGAKSAEGDATVPCDPLHADAAGRAPLRGLPRVPGASAEVRVRAPVSRAAIEAWKAAVANQTAGQPTPPDPIADAEVVTVTVPLDAAPGTEIPVVFGAQRRATVAETAPTVSSVGLGGTILGPRSEREARVRVLRADGSPAAGVTVNGFRSPFVTDARGAFSAKVHAASDTILWVTGPGFVPTARVVTLTDAAEVEFREAPSSPVLVRVTDAAGRPVIGACVTLACEEIPVRDVPAARGQLPPLLTRERIRPATGETQELVLRTDGEGRLVAALPDGRIRVQATVAGHGVSRVFTVAGGGEAIDVVLPAPPAAAATPKAVGEEQTRR